MNFKEAIEQFQNHRPAKGLWKQIRQSGRDHFLAQGLPSKDLETWHYTSLKSFPEDQLIPAAQMPSLKKSQLANRIQEYLNPEFYNVVFVDGKLNKDLSSKTLAKGLVLSAIGSKKSLTVLTKIRTARAKVGEIRQDAMEALNSAFARDGLVLELSKDSSVKKPLQILHLKTNPNALYPKLLMNIGANSSLQLIETFVTLEVQKELPSRESLLDSATEINLEAAARLQYIRLQAQGLESSHVGSTRFILERDSWLDCLTVAAGSKLARHNLYVHCIGKQAFAYVNGLSISDKEQHIDNSTLIDHVVGECTTSQLYKSILGGNSKTIFCGRVQIRKDAQKASSEQLNQNLLLSKTAEANSKPELGIFADDVKASHGSSIGQVNAEEVFYLMSRAISRTQALEMLSLGFVQGLVEKQLNPVCRRWLTEIVLRQFRNLGRTE